MACRGVHFALAPEQELELLSASGDEEVMEVIESIEEKWEKEFLVESDKAWDAIHRCLTDGRLSFDSRAHPLGAVILGGRHLHEGEDYIVAFVARDEVPGLASSLSGLSESWLRERYFSLLGADEYDGEIGEEDFEYTWVYLSEIQKFFNRASQSGRSVVFTVDQ